jgi:hypothetical protein
MCGIAGFIGESTNPRITYSLMTSLLAKTEIRGKEATGFWGAQGAADGKIIYHKEPTPSGEFVKGEMWKRVEPFNPAVLLAHCREPSASAGSPKVNKNNHPHVSEDFTTALVHNGRVDEYHALKNKGYQSKLRGDCDSEIILRLFERGEPYRSDLEFLNKRYPDFEPEAASRLYGLEYIFAKLLNGAMAVAVGERQEGRHRSLWLWRDDKRPIWLVDLRESLNQIFFCSTEKIWAAALDAVPEVKKYLPADHLLYEFPAFYVFLLEHNPDAIVGSGQGENPWQEGGWRSRRVSVTRERVEGKEPEDPQPTVPDTTSRPPIMVLTQLEEDESVVSHPVWANTAEPEATEKKDEDVVELPLEVVIPEVEAYTLSHDPDPEPEEKPEVRIEEAIVRTTTKKGEHWFDIKKMSDTVDTLASLVKDIGVLAGNKALEGSISPTDFENMLEELNAALEAIRAAKITHLRS